MPFSTASGTGTGICLTRSHAGFSVPGDAVPLAALLWRPSSPVLLSVTLSVGLSVRWVVLSVCLSARFLLPGLVVWLPGLFFWPAWVGSKPMGFLCPALGMANQWAVLPSWLANPVAGCLSVRWLGSGRLVRGLGARRVPFGPRGWFRLLPGLFWAGVGLLWPCFLFFLGLAWPLVASRGLSWPRSVSRGLSGSLWVSLGLLVSLGHPGSLSVCCGLGRSVPGPRFPGPSLPHVIAYAFTYFF